LDGGASSVDHILLKGQPSKAKRAEDAQEAGAVDELWKLAERMGGQEEESTAHLLLQDVSGKGQGNVQTQSADEALAALQALAAEAAQTKQADGDLLEEFSRMESSLEGLPQLDSLQIELSPEANRSELDEAPELELDALESFQALVETRAAPEPIAQAAASDAVDAPELVLEGLAEAQEESLAPPELNADYAAEQPEWLEPPDEVLDELLAASEASDEQSCDLDPPEPADFELAAAAPVARRAPKVAPKLRPAAAWRQMIPIPSLPEGGYALKPWTDALAAAGPDRVSLLSPIKFLELRKSSLNGAASATFAPVQFRASQRIAAVDVPISEPKSPARSYEAQDDALMPSSTFFWPSPLHTAWIAAEMRPHGTTQSVSAAEPFFSVKQPTLSAEFLTKVALQSRILEPQCSAILSPLERGAYASAAAEEEESGSEYASAAGRSDRDETDGGERANVADLF
jgi:hypothetical protein